MPKLSRVPFGDSYHGFRLEVLEDPSLPQKGLDACSIGAAAAIGYSMVRAIGLEPTLPCGNWNLNPARLPVSPHPHRWGNTIGHDSIAILAGRGVKRFHQGRHFRQTESGPAARTQGTIELRTETRRDPQDRV